MVSKKNHDIRGFTMVEAIISLLIMSIFFIGSLQFFSVQNKNIEQLRNSQVSQDLTNEAENYLLTQDFSELPVGNYGLYFKPSISAGSSNSYLINPVALGDDTNERGKFVHSDGTLVDFYEYNGKDKVEGIYKRIIKIEQPFYPFSHQLIKKITIQLWSKECDFSSDPCLTRTLMKSSGNYN